MKEDEKMELTSAEVNSYAANDDCGKSKVACEEDCPFQTCWITCDGQARQRFQDTGGR